MFLTSKILTSVSSVLNLDFKFQAVNLQYDRDTDVCGIRECQTFYEMDSNDVIFHKLFCNCRHFIKSVQQLLVSKR